MCFTFRFKYAMLSLLLFFAEVLIATIGRDNFFLRAYVGDVLVVMLLYTLILTFVKVHHRGRLVLGIFIFAMLVEALQYTKLAELLGFPEGSLANILLGNTFSWADIVCYGVGSLITKVLASKYEYQDK